MWEWTGLYRRERGGGRVWIGLCGREWTGLYRRERGEVWIGLCG